MLQLIHVTVWTFRECWNILKDRHWTGSEHTDHFASGVRMGIGAYNLVRQLSLCRAYVCTLTFVENWCMWQYSIEGWGSLSRPRVSNEPQWDIHCLSAAWSHYLHSPLWALYYYQYHIFLITSKLCCRRIHAKSRHCNNYYAYNDFEIWKRRFIIYCVHLL
jgi:hypothetical protein